MRLFLFITAFMAAHITPHLMSNDWNAARAQVMEVEEKPRLIAARFTADWCGQCAILQPRLDDVWPAYEDAEIERVVFDFTSDERDTPRARAAAAGIEHIYEPLEGRTGFLLLIDRESGEVLEMVNTSYDRAAIADALDRSLMMTQETQS